MLGSGRQAELRDIRPPVEIPVVWLWVVWSLAALALAAAAWSAWRYWRRRHPGQPAVDRVVPPHERARQRFREAAAYIDQPRPFCILVSDTIRVYLEERFELRAPERTTEEFLTELGCSPLLTAAQKSALGDFLAVCDLVKFARYEPIQTELEPLLRVAERLVNETEPPPPVAPGAQAPSAPSAASAAPRPERPESVSPPAP
jgi:hypothetical protein